MSRWLSPQHGLGYMAFGFFARKRVSGAVDALTAYSNAFSRADMAAERHASITDEYGYIAVSTVWLRVLSNQYA